MKTSILPDFLENWHFISHFVWKSTKTLELLRIFDKLFDVINGEPFLTLCKTSANNNNKKSEFVFKPSNLLIPFVHFGNLWIKHEKRVTSEQAVIFS